jgi:hypothetical protein
MEPVPACPHARSLRCITVSEAQGSFKPCDICDELSFPIVPVIRARMGQGVEVVVRSTTIGQIRCLPGGLGLAAGTTSMANDKTMLRAVDASSCSAADSRRIMERRKAGRDVVLRQTGRYRNGPSVFRRCEFARELAMCSSTRLETPCSSRRAAIPDGALLSCVWTYMARERD